MQAKINSSRRQVQSGNTYSSPLKTLERHNDDKTVVSFSSLCYFNWHLSF